MTFHTGRLPPRWSGQRALAASVVFAAHLLMLWAVWQLRQLAQPQGHATQAIPIRFIPDRRARAEPQTQSGKGAAAPLPARTRAVAISPLVNATPVESPAEDAAPPGSGAVASAEATGQSGPPAAASGMAAPAPGPLALKPGRDVMLGSLANPAVSDPRSNTPKPTFEERIAMGLDPGLCVKHERLPNGEIRRRMGRMVNAQSAIQNTHGAGPHGIKVCE